MKNGQIRAAIFDMDGTIYDTERVYAEGWKRGAAAYGYTLTDEMICRFHGRSPEDNCRIFQEWFGAEAPYWEVRQIRTEYIRAYIEENGVPTKPGLYELLQALRERQIPAVIATGSERERAESYARKTGIWEEIRFFVCREDVRRSKPHPEIFLTAASLLKLPPSDCLVFEDSENGIEAALQAGCHVWMNPDMDPVTDRIRQRVDYVLRDLGEAADLIRKEEDKHELV